ncbi:MAG: hypothetical protein LKF75_03965 [Bacilli bacterium]|nr:hypothetical protein [Bacilli bacterium]MCH4210421.1 hypothetical protein [Bacilli bacterium]MCH4228833.1 hypothetical protein [Bacilli bacterium]MCH4278299.1 hypothetical protein [Bacilli bacterium]MCI2055029.1 hypothetical protein [Bacilli bacterium]
MEKNKQNQIIIYVQLEYLDGPIFKDILPANKGKPAEKGPFGGIKLITGVPVIDRDPEVARLEREVESLYSGCFSENSHEQPLYFDKGYASSIKGKLSLLVSELLERLKAINDGSFIIVNRAEDDMKEF